MRPPELRLFGNELIRDSGRFVPGRSYSPDTQFQPGTRFSPQTEFKEGERRSPATEFKTGNPARNKLPVGSETVRTSKRTGKQRAWVKIAEPNIWRPRAVFVWERINGPLPRGMIVHHEDRDSLNDAPSNLAALTRKDHAAEHRAELLEGAVAAFQVTKARVSA